MLSDLSSYSLSDFLLFSPEIYYRMIARYHAALWPAGQIIAAAAVIRLLVWLARPVAGRDRPVLLGLFAAAWGVAAWAFLWERYQTINWAAATITWVFAAQALLLLTLAMTGGLALDRRAGVGAGIGTGLMLVGLLVLPLVGPLTVREDWTAAELFGLTPDPTALATLGLVLIARGRLRLLLLPIPLAWCVLGGATLRAMEAPDAWILWGAALAAVLAELAGMRRGRTQEGVPGTAPPGL